MAIPLCTCPLKVVDVMNAKSARGRRCIQSVPSGRRQTSRYIVSFGSKHLFDTMFGPADDSNILSDMAEKMQVVFKVNREQEKDFAEKPPKEPKGCFYRARGDSEVNKAIGDLLKLLV